MQHQPVNLTSTLHSPGSVVVVDSTAGGGGASVLAALLSRASSSTVKDMRAQSGLWRKRCQLHMLLQQVALTLVAVAVIIVVGLVVDCCTHARVNQFADIEPHTHTYTRTEPHTTTTTRSNDELWRKLLFLSEASLNRVLQAARCKLQITKLHFKVLCCAAWRRFRRCRRSMPTAATTLHTKIESFLWHAHPQRGREKGELH